MAEVKTFHSTVSSDDVHVLRVLLHAIKGISPVSTTEFATVSADDE